MCGVVKKEFGYDPTQFKLKLAQAIGQDPDEGGIKYVRSLLTPSGGTYGFNRLVEIELERPASRALSYSVEYQALTHEWRHLFEHEHRAEARKRLQAYNCSYIPPE